jgi:hypothetical protein
LENKTGDDKAVSKNPTTDEKPAQNKPKPAPNKPKTPHNNNNNNNNNVSDVLCFGPLRQMHVTFINLVFTAPLAHHPCS